MRLWAWQEGTPESDSFHVAVMGKDGSAYLAGRTSGSYNMSIDEDEEYFAAVKLDSGGNVLWRWQVNHVGRARIQPQEPILGLLLVSFFYLA